MHVLYEFEFIFRTRTAILYGLSSTDADFPNPHHPLLLPRNRSRNLPSTVCVSKRENKTININHWNFNIV